LNRKKLLNIIGIIPFVITTFLFIVTPAFADDSQMIFASAPENGIIILQAPDNAYFDYVEFASYGTPDQLKQGRCHSKQSQEIVEEYVLGNDYAEIPASNGIFGDPCGGTYKRLNVYVHYEYTEISPYLNEPTNLSYYIQNDYLTLTWDIPEDSGVEIERYAIFWSTDPENGWGIASITNSYSIPLSIIRSTDGSNKFYEFTIRSDNDTEDIYSGESEPISIFIADFVEPSPSPTQTSSPEPTPSQTPTVEPSPSWTPTVLPSPSPSETFLTPEPTPIFSKTPEPVVTPTVVPQPSVSSPEATPTLSESPTSSDSPSPSSSATPENTPSINDTTDVKVQSILENLVPGEAVTTENLEALGLTYADLPPETPVSLPNGVVLTAKVADAIQIFNSPSAVVSAIFTDPGKALTAIANIGADMTPKVRKQSQKVVVASVIAAQILSTTSVVGRVIK
jgi:hypothetical protein